MANEVVIKITDKGTAKKYAKNVKGADKATNKLVNSAKLLVVAYGAIRALKIGVDFAKQAAQVKRSEQALIQFTGSMTAASNATQAMQAALKNTVSESTATAIATKLMGLELAKTGKEAAELARIAATLGGVFGKDATQAVEEFTLLLANQSILRLDTFGLSGARVRERIKELQAETKGLSRETAFLTAVMEQGTIKADLLAASLEDDVAVSDRFDSVMEDLSVTLGEKLSPAFVKTTGFLTDFARGFNILLGGGTTADQIALLEARIRALGDTFLFAGKREDLQTELDILMARLSVEERQAVILEDQAKAKKQQQDLLNSSLAILKAENDEAKKRKDIEKDLLKAKEASIKLTIEQSLLGRGTVKEAVSNAIRGEAAKAIAAYIASSFSSLPLPLAIIAAAGSGAIIGKLFDAVIPSFAQGGDFVTQGPQFIRVGDNPSGRERVRIEPDPAVGGAQGVTIVVQADPTGGLFTDWLRNSVNPELARIQVQG